MSSVTVDFAIRKSPAYRVAGIAWKGSWSEAKIRSNFARLEKWAKANHLRTGKWFFREPNPRSFEVLIEVRGAARSAGGIRVRKFPAARVAAVTFDPEVVSPRVIYHGIYDWLRWQRKEKTIRSVGDYREVYTADPWRSAKAWAHTTIEVVVRP